MIRLDRLGGGAYRLIGDIDEEADLAGLPDEPLILDMSQMGRINSMGIVIWQRWRRARSSPTTLEHVPVSFVLALSCVAGLAEGMRIRSVLAPFVDPETDHREECELDAAALAQVHATWTCPTMRSKLTARPLSLDDDPAQYFAFLGSPRAPTLQADR